MFLTLLAGACGSGPRDLPAPSSSWTPLPDGFEPRSVAEAGGSVLIGGRNPDTSAAVLQGHVDAGRFVLDGAWSLPVPPTLALLPPGEIVESTAIVDAALVSGVPIAVVNIMEYQGGSWGHWLRVLGTDTWEFVPNVSIEDDIGVGRIGIAEGALFAFEGPGADVPGGNLWQLRRGDRRQPFPKWRDPSHASWWHPSRVALPGRSWVGWSLSVTPDGRWLAVQAFDGTRQEAVLLARRGHEMTAHRRIPLPMSAWTQVAVTSEHLVVLELPDGDPVRLSWYPLAHQGPARELALPQQRGEVDRLRALGTRALVTLEDAFVVDLAAGSLLATLPLPEPGWREGVLTGTGAVALVIG